MSVATIAQRAVSHWLQKRGPSQGAALAYYSAFSLSPLLLIAIAIAGFVFGEQAVREAIVAQLGALIGNTGATAVREMLAGGHLDTTSSTLACAIGFVALFLGATSVFAELQAALDDIWDAPVRPAQGFWRLVRTRMLSFSLVLAIGFLLLVSLLASAALTALVTYYAKFIDGQAALLHAAHVAVSIVVLTVLFAAIYKWLPNVAIVWKDVWLGAAVTAVLFSLGQTAIGLYLGQAAIASSFGAAGAFVVLMVWLYYSAQVFLLGAALSYVLSENRRNCLVARMHKDVVIALNAASRAAHFPATKSLLKWGCTAFVVYRLMRSKRRVRSLT